MVTKEARLYWMSRLKARFASGVDNVKLHLITEEIEITDDTEYSDVNAADHESLTNNFEDVFTTDPTIVETSAVLQGIRVEWENEGEEEVTIYGWYAASAGGNLVNAKLLTVPVAVPAGVTFGFTPKLYLNPLSEGGGGEEGPFEVTRYPALHATLGGTETSNEWLPDGGGGSVLTAGSEGNVMASYINGAFDSTQDMRAKGFDFQIPDDATITGFKVTVRRKTTVSASLRDLKVGLVGVTGSSDNKADSGLDWPTSFANKEYGGEGDLWGTTPTVEEVNATTFGVDIAATLTGSDNDPSIEFVSITVYYE